MSQVRGPVGGPASSTGGSLAEAVGLQERAGSDQGSLLGQPTKMRRYPFVGHNPNPELHLLVT